MAKSGQPMIHVSESRSTQMNKKSLKTSTDKQVKDGDSYFTQEDKQRKQILGKIVQPVRDQRDGNEGSLGIAIYT